ncbi:Lariat debranching enzyme [Seminavis robusta]|uniref:Lariat debranching enzyme n=1 Tax=Seminavis robusta TaxID=568900 RepID=A0A9N8E0A5_9STRA|nr:Lariat debranching enzyme [Seminavis robusta]|eukprot:Sro521_g159490.1 Lariat debranching enzyme (491) ;mRNA; f:57941-59413
MDHSRITVDLRRPLGKGQGERTTVGGERQRRLAQLGYVPISSERKARFAVVGDVHGQFSLLARKLEAICEKNDFSLDFVLQVGDLECHRNDDDLRSMAAPAKKRTLGDFWKACQDDDFYMRHPMYFIGGNHECYGWLDNESHFAADGTNLMKGFLEVAPNVFYLGRAGYLPIRFFEKPAKEATEDTDEHPLDVDGILNLGFLSGIHRPADYYHRRPAMTENNLANESNKRWIGFNVYDTQLLLEDENDDGIDHARESCLEERENEPPTSRKEMRRRLVAVLARLLGVNLRDDQHLDSDVLLSSADVEYLTRFLIAPAASAEETAENRRTAAQSLPRSLDAISRVLMKGRSVADVTNMMENRLKRKRACDILLTHDWPAGIVDEREIKVVGKRSRPAGNEVCREVTDGLKPKVHCCGHMHRGFRREIKHKTPSGKPSKKTTDLCCLGKVGLSGSAAFAVFELDLESGELIELGQDAQLYNLQPFDEDEDDD